MASNAAKGAYYKAKTRKWLAGLGWQVGELEQVHWLFTPRGRIPVKRDQFASDLIGVGPTCIIFVQVKGGEQAAGGGQFLDAQRAFAAFTFPPGSQQWIVAWAPGARQPRVIKCRRTDGQEEVRKESRTEEEDRTEEGTGSRQGSALGPVADDGAGSARKAR